MAKKRETIRIDFAKKVAKMGVSVFTFREGNHYVAYIPSLKLSDYGRTKKEAQEMLVNDVLDDFFRTLFSLGIQEKIARELAKYGWKRVTKASNEFNAPFVDKTDLLKNFNLPTATKLTQDYLTHAEKSAA